MSPALPLSAFPVVRALPNAIDVLDAFGCVASLPYPLLLESSAINGDTGMYSFLAAAPRVVLRAHGKTVEIREIGARTIVRNDARILDVAREFLPDARAMRAEPHESEAPPFQGGIAGYIGYEYGGTLERLPRATTDDVQIPDAVLGIYEWVLAWDHRQQRTWLFAQDDRIADAILPRCTSNAEQPLADDTLRREPHELTSTFTRAAYETAIERVQEYIRAGDIFQVNLSQRFSAPWTAQPSTLYARVRARNPAPFAAYFDIGDAVIVSASPERFLHVDRTGAVETRPIKGTRPRTGTTDDAQRDALLQSEKDAAEHVMIVDVLRNDLSRVCEYGSVRVPQLMLHELHPTVHHLVSTVTGQLRPDADAIDLLHACFPGGSITGAPKIRAMEIIAELEPVTRGVYCGAIGYVSVTGAMDTSIAIRTAVVKDGCVHFSAGGGIVADSVPAAEYDETLDKARAIRQALNM